jgi:hypothetical protein
MEKLLAILFFYLFYVTLDMDIGGVWTRYGLWNRLEEHRWHSVEILNRRFISLKLIFFLPQYFESVKLFTV